MTLSNKQRFANMLEWLVNDYQKDKLQEFYGEGTGFKVISVDFLPTKKVCNIHGKIILGETFDQLSLESDMAVLLTGKALAMVVPDFTGNVSISVDV